MNHYLGYALKSKQTALSKYLNFERAVVALEQDLCRLTVERSLYGFPLCTSTYFNASIQNDTLVVKNRGGAIGRMPVHPALMRYGGFLFSDLAAVVERERKSARQAGGDRVPAEARRPHAALSAAVNETERASDSRRRPARSGAIFP